MQTDGKRMAPEIHLTASNRIKQKCNEYINMDDATRLANGTAKWIELTDLYAEYKIPMPSDDMEDLVEESVPADEDEAGAGQGEESAAADKDRASTKQLGSSSSLPN
jgi:hypothetical protein